jgi:hypothetical protein
MTIAQRLPKPYEEKLVTFQKHVLKLRKQYEYRLGQTGNADQNSVYFDMPECTTVNFVGEQMMQIRSI